jgi:hypothetical protein
LEVIAAALSKKPDPPVVPVIVPTPNGDAGGLPDDIIPVPEGAAAEVVKATLHLFQAQLSRQRFPQSAGVFHPAPGEAINYGSKAWFTATAYDTKGHEFLRDRVLKFGLAYLNKFYIRNKATGEVVVSCEGKGADEVGAPSPGYTLNGNAQIGVGSTAWISSLGFNWQVKLFEEGEYEAWAIVAGIETNHVEFKVS